MEEVPIPGASKYTISDDGTVRSYADRRRKDRLGSVLRPQYNRGHQYLQVRLLFDDGTMKTRYIHHLVSESFIGKRPKGYDIDHIDGNKLNNNASNLRYVTRKENMTNSNNLGKNGWQLFGSRKVLVAKDGYVEEYPNLKTACDILGLSLPNASCNIRGVKKNCGLRNGKPHLVSVKSVNGYTFAWSADDEIDNKDNIVKAQSTTSDIIGIAKSLLNFIIGKSEKREEKRDKIMKQIEEQKEELKKALSEGRISDAGSISSTISKLYKKFNKVGLFSAIALCLMLSGCKTTKLAPDYNPPLVLGERVFICKEKDIIEIPTLVPPATKWYLVDNIGLTQWLGIPANQQP